MLGVLSKASVLQNVDNVLSYDDEDQTMLVTCWKHLLEMRARHFLFTPRETLRIVIKLKVEKHTARTQIQRKYTGGSTC